MKRSFLWEADIQTRNLNFLHGIQYFLAKSLLVFVCFVFNFVFYLLANASNWYSGQRIWEGFWWWRLMQLFSFTNLQLIPQFKSSLLIAASSVLADSEPRVSPGFCQADWLPSPLYELRGTRWYLDSLDHLSSPIEGICSHTAPIIHKFLLPSFFPPPLRKSSLNFQKLVAKTTHKARSCSSGLSGG